MNADTGTAAPLGYPDQAPDKGHRSGALGLVSSVVVGMAWTAPADSLAASLGFVVATTNGDGIVGVKAPAIMLLAFVPTFLIAVAYQELNRAEPDCGTTFTWATRAFGAWVGRLGGWGIIAADVIVMANLAQIAGSYSYQLVGADSLAGSSFWSMVAGVVWIVVMTYICYRGIEVSARLQYALLGIEVLVLVIFSVVALVKVWGGTAPEGSLTPSLTWLSYPEYGNTTVAGIGGVFVLGIGSLLLGVVLMFAYRAIAPAFFHRETLSRRSAKDLVLVETGAEGPTLRLPDPGLPGIVIAPDRSNLPPGAHIGDPARDNEAEESD